MSPHAMPPDSESSGSRTPSSGSDAYEDGKTKIASCSSLKRYPDDEVHDVICIGFGPASLAIAVALNDALEERDPSLSTQRPKVRFLEKQPHFAWHAGMLLPGTKMQITFLKDMATLRNPRSKFTFLNYLHTNDRLVAFTNLSTFLPQRIEYEDYMRWCANHFEDVVDYSQDVRGVEVGQKNSTGAVEYWNVRSFDHELNRTITRKAKQVVIATGGRPNIPKTFQANHPRVIHSSQYGTQIDQMFSQDIPPRSIAVIGGGQSAAEIFHNLPSRLPNTKSYLVIKGAALRPSDDSPFVNEVFDPDRVDDVYSQDPQVRAGGIAQDKGTNYGVVRLELLEEIYSSLYLQRIRYGDEQQWPHRILPYCEVTGMSASSSKHSGPAIRLEIQDSTSNFHARRVPRTKSLDVDLVIVASGYRRDAHEDMLQSVRHVMPNGGVEGERWSVSRDYKADCKDGAVSPEAGIWLQGCNENTHGLSDTLLSILAVRGGEMVQSMFGHANQTKSNGDTKSTTMNGHNTDEEYVPQPIQLSKSNSAGEPPALELRPLPKSGVCSMLP